MFLFSRKTLVACVVIACAFVAREARAAVLAVNPSKDNALAYSVTPTAQLSNGAGQHIFAGRTNQEATVETATTSLRRGLVAFDVSPIPAGSTINSVTLTLFFDMAPDTRTFPISVHRLLADWGEGASNAGGVGSGGGGGMGAAAAQNDATWLYRFYNAASPTSSPTWTSPGAEGDYVTTASASTSITGSQGTPIAHTWSGAGLIADVQAWVDGSSGNFGWLLKGIENQGGGTVRRFESRQNSNNGTGSTVDARPLLTIDFTPVPEPSALAIVLVAGLLVARRRASRERR